MTEPAARILVVDDDLMLAQAIAKLLKRSGFAVEVCDDGGEAIRRLDSFSFDGLILDVFMPGTDGWRVLERASALPEPPVTIMMTGAPDVRAAVQAMQKGAADFLEKPLDLADLAARLHRALESVTLRRRLCAVEPGGPKRAPVATSDAMKRVLDVADRVAASPSSSALILGESGVGKELVAARIHEQSTRRVAPFIKVNLAAMAESMIEAELFGSVRGAYTDAKKDRAGLFASADGGTLLLDELCEFRFDLQAKLLRALEERRFFPVGSDRERRVNVRIVASTNQCPEAAIVKGLLREDLYYRIGTVIIDVPPLRKRREDVLPLADSFLTQFAGEFGRSPVALDADARAALLDYPWPGNVRELRNVVERAIMMTDGDVIGLEALCLRGGRAEPLRESAKLRLGEVKQDAMTTIEREHIERALQTAAGSRRRAAELLGVSRTTLWEKMKRYGMQ